MFKIPATLFPLQVGNPDLSLEFLISLKVLEAYCPHLLNVYFYVRHPGIGSEMLLFAYKVVLKNQEITQFIPDMLMSWSAYFILTICL